MTRWAFTFEIDLPDYAVRTKLIELMADAAESYGCEVQGWVHRERVDPPLGAVPEKAYGGTDGAD